MTAVCQRCGRQDPGAEWVCRASDGRTLCYRCATSTFIVAPDADRWECECQAHAAQTRNVPRLDGRRHRRDCEKALELLRRVTGSAGLEDKAMGWRVWPAACPVCIDGALLASVDMLPRCTHRRGCLESEIVERLRARPGHGVAIANTWRDARHAFERRHGLAPLDAPVVIALEPREAA